MVKYVYDAWGNHEVKVLDSACTELSQLNPYRYRGYYYDTETGLYFLKTRYYDPTTCRFVTIDDLQYIDPETINGLNLYAYCANNPVMAVDPEGNKPKWWQWLLFGFAAVIAVAAIVVGSMLTGGALIGFVSATLIGAGVGFITSAGASIVSQGITNGWSNIDPMKALASGGIGAAIGAISGFMSFGFQAIAKPVGEVVGFHISQITIKGLSVGKAFADIGGVKAIMSIMRGVSGFVGALVGGAVGNHIANDLFGQPTSIEEDMRESVNGWVQDFFINILGKLFKWIRR